MEVSVQETRAEERFVHDLAQQLRVDSIRCTTAAGSGHPTSALSSADLMAALFAWHLRYDWDAPEDPGNDHLIFSKGHASPLLYSLFKAAGVVSDDELMATYRRSGSRLQGHPTPELPWVDVATGSLGQGLPAGVGIALAGKRLDKREYRVWVLCGDSEMAEGSVWEALDKASHYALSNLTVIVDVNRLGQRGPTELGWDLETYRRRVEAFGCLAIVIDGHDLGEIDRAYTQAEAADRPSVIIAGTRKGEGVPEVEDKDGWHGKPLPVEMGEDGPSQMGLEDSAALRAVHGSTVLYPSDATSAAALTAEMVHTSGVVYLRTTRGAYPVLYAAGEEFPVRGSKVVRRSDTAPWSRAPRAARRCPRGPSATARPRRSRRRRETRTAGCSPGRSRPCG